VIRSIVEQTGVKIDVEDSGLVKVASSDQASAAKALQIIGDITATAEVGKTYLGKVTRLADFGAFVEIIPGTDGLLHISEVAEHRINDVRDELKEGDQVLVKVLAVEGNRIRLSRKAILKEQRAKMGGQSAEVQPTGDGAGQHVPISTNGGESITIEGGADFEEGDDEPNFNRAEGEPAHAAAAGEGQGQRREGGGRPGGGGGGRRRRHHGRRGGGGDRGPGGGGRR
jgi:polyribonucleotide nucleotidyltransferase